MQSPPASADATRVIILSPVFARPGALPRSRRCWTSWGRPRCRANVAGRISPALLTRRWSSKAMWMPSGELRGSILRGSIYWVLLVTCTQAQEHFLTHSTRRHTYLVGGLGLRTCLQFFRISTVKASTTICRLVLSSFRSSAGTFPARRKTARQSGQFSITCSTGRMGRCHSALAGGRSRGVAACGAILRALGDFRADFALRPGIRSGSPGFVWPSSSAIRRCRRSITAWVTRR